MIVHLQFSMCQLFVFVQHKETANTFKLCVFLHGSENCAEVIGLKSECLKAFRWLYCGQYATMFTVVEL